MTAVVAALPEELAELRRRARIEDRGRLPHGRYGIGQIGSCEILAAVVGDGPVRARRGLEALLRAAPVRRILAIGIAGAASQGLPSAAVVLPGRVFREAEPAPDPDPAWLERALRSAGLRSGVLVTVERPMFGPIQRAELARRFEDQTVLADLETAAWAELAAARGIPYLAARAVFDRPEEELPSWIGSCASADGGISRRKVLLQAVARPQRLLELARMRDRMRRCASNLAETVEALL